MKKQLNRIIEYGLIIITGLLYSISLKYFVLPSKIILTGTEGIALSLSYYLDNYNIFISLYLIFQSLLITFGFIKVSKFFALRSFVVVTTVVLGLAVLPELKVAQPEPQNKRIIQVLFGGLLSGIAKAVAFKNRGSTGDEDILGAYFAMKLLKPVGAISILAAVISTSFGFSMEFLKSHSLEGTINSLIYTCIYIFVSAETLNNLYKKFQITLLTIITETPKKIGNTIKKLLTTGHIRYKQQKAVTAVWSSGW
ncbi:MAG: YitT family protein [Spirochaetales bacterium]|nr:YitT family protein [Spirochaetales bacterium]